MTRQEYVVKWSIYGLALLFLFLLENTVFNRFSVLGVFPLLLPSAVAVVAVFEGPNMGTGFGLAAGLLQDAVSLQSNGSMVLGLSLAGLLAGLMARDALSRSFIGCVLCAGGILAAVNLCRLAYLVFFEQTSAVAVLRVAVPELLYSMLFIAPIYFLFRGIYRRVGGSMLL